MPKLGMVGSDAILGYPLLATKKGGDMEALIDTAVIIAGGVICAFFLGLGISLFKADRNYYEANRRLTGKPSNAIKGTVQSFHESDSNGRDHHVHAGVAITKDGTVIQQGGLSSEAISSIVK